VRYYETRNDMQYQSCNPLTGQWGRLLNDGSGLSLVGANTLAGANPAGTSANAYNASAATSTRCARWASCPRPATSRSQPSRTTTSR
jgi:hypothetical protein